MCQAFEGEQRWMNMMEKDARKDGYNAFHAGMSKEDAPKHPMDFPEAWLMGFGIAECNGGLF